MFVEASSLLPFPRDISKTKIKAKLGTKQIYRRVLNRESRRKDARSMKTGIICKIFCLNLFFWEESPDLSTVTTQKSLRMTLGNNAKMISNVGPLQTDLMIVTLTLSRVGITALFCGAGLCLPELLQGVMLEPSRLALHRKVLTKLNFGAVK